jgi:hypothetical protein
VVVVELTAGRGAIVVLCSVVVVRLIVGAGAEPEEQLASRAVPAIIATPTAAVILIIVSLPEIRTKSC